MFTGLAIPANFGVDLDSYASYKRVYMKKHKIYVRLANLSERYIDRFDKVLDTSLHPLVMYDAAGFYRGIQYDYLIDHNYHIVNPQLRKAVVSMLNSNNTVSQAMYGLFQANPDTWIEMEYDPTDVRHEINGYAYFACQVPAHIQFQAPYSHGATTTINNPARAKYSQKGDFIIRTVRIQNGVIPEVEVPYYPGEKFGRFDQGWYDVFPDRLFAATFDCRGWEGCYGKYNPPDPPKTQKASHNPLGTLPALIASYCQVRSSVHQLRGVSCSFAVSNAASHCIEAVLRSNSFLVNWVFSLSLEEGNKVKLVCRGNESKFVNAVYTVKTLPLSYLSAAPIGNLIIKIIFGAGTVNKSTLAPQLKTLTRNTTELLSKFMDACDARLAESIHRPVNLKYIMQQSHIKVSDLSNYYLLHDLKVILPIVISSSANKSIYYFIINAFVSSDAIYSDYVQCTLAKDKFGCEKIFYFNTKKTNTTLIAQDDLEHAGMKATIAALAQLGGK